MARYYSTASTEESMQATYMTAEITPTPTPTTTPLAESTSFVTVVYTQTVYN
jgi:hypothetical protein